MSNQIPEYIEREIALKRIFNQDAKLPETEIEIKEWFLNLAGDLSPENLTCDGELSSADVNRRYNEIMKSWDWLEKKLGRNVSEDEAWNFRADIRAAKEECVK